MFVTNQFVFLKNQSQDKADAKWKGPFKIIKVNSNNNITIEEGNKFTKQNIKNIKPYFNTLWEGQDVVSKN